MEPQRADAQGDGTDALRVQRCAGIYLAVRAAMCCHFAALLPLLSSPCKMELWQRQTTGRWNRSGPTPKVLELQVARGFELRHVSRPSFSVDRLDRLVDMPVACLEGGMPPSQLSTFDKTLE